MILQRLHHFHQNIVGTENQGDIHCGPGGTVNIRCNEYFNRGTIVPVPFINIGVKCQQKGTKKKVQKTKRLIPLEIYDFRGCISKEHHPANLLNDNIKSCYIGHNRQYDEDWIIFRIVGNKTVNPKTVTVGNCENEAGDDKFGSVSTGTLWMGTDDNDWFKVARDVTKIKAKGKPQKFKLTLTVSEEELMKRKANLLMVGLKTARTGGQYTGEVQFCYKYREWRPPEDDSVKFSSFKLHGCWRYCNSY